MKRTTNQLRVCAIVAVALLPPGEVAAQVTILHSFAGGATDGKNPSGSLTLSGATLYAMTSTGGAAADGTVFQIGTDGTGFGLLHSFVSGLNDGRNPSGSLIQVGPAFYGMTQFGGSAGGGGTVFQINADGTGFGLLHRFVVGAADGVGPLGTLAQSGSTLYGMTPQGGAANLGTLFKVNADGTGLGLLHSFTNSPADGQTPSFSSLVVSGSTLYGMTAGGGTAGLARFSKSTPTAPGSTCCTLSFRSPAMAGHRPAL